MPLRDYAVIVGPALLLVGKALPKTERGSVSAAALLLAGTVYSGIALYDNLSRR